MSRREALLHWCVTGQPQEGPREHDYKTAQAWLRILARLKDDEPIIKRDPEAIGTVFEDTREFLINVMGADAHKRPSELIDDD